MDMMLASALILLLIGRAHRTLNVVEWRAAMPHAASRAVLF
jgi:hypothetical protein